MDKHLKKDYPIIFRHFGEIVVPKGTKTTSITAMGLDENYNFVDEFDWIDKKYPDISNILKMDMQNYGLNVPLKYLENGFLQDK